MTKEEAILHMTLRREILKHSVGDLDEDIKAFDMAIEALEQAPKKGRWIDLKYNEEWYGRCYTCSVCNAEMVGAENYCPNCGSYMKEDKE